MCDRSILNQADHLVRVSTIWVGKILNEMILNPIHHHP